MNVLADLRNRFAAAFTALGETPGELVEMVRRSQDPKFGDYQANCAMPLAKKLGKSPREVAAAIIEVLKIDDICEPAVIAGPGFINLRLRINWLESRLNAAVRDERLGLPKVAQPRTYVIDYSAPNVAKPMHVGHIRSTVIGDSLYRTLEFLGHRVISDNHIGDWGTQFGMIIYGYRHFRDDTAHRAKPVAELARLYRVVHGLVDYFESRDRLTELRSKLAAAERAVEAEAASVKALPPLTDKQARSKADKTLRQSHKSLEQLREEVAGLQQKVTSVEGDPAQKRLVEQHSNIAAEVLAETAKLHASDPENLALWKQFLPACMADIEHIYKRLGVSFDDTLGESFYQDRLAKVVEDLKSRGLARESEGAVAVFLPDQPAPMLIQKQDGAFLYATTDLATIQYRMEQWRPDAILYVVDHRQSLHFEHLFATARLWGFDEVELQHISFGTVLGDDGRPFKTRSGDTVGLEGLLDEAVRRAGEIVAQNDNSKPDGPELSADERKRIAEAVGVGALKYADLSQNRTSDYVFSYDKMLAMNGNTATYMQYAHARVRSILAKGKVDIETVVRDPKAKIRLGEPAERALGVQLLAFGEALDQVVADYRPNQLTGYLFELANRYSTFFEQCPVLKAETPEKRTSRLLLCQLTARTLKKGLDLLGISVVDQM